MPIFNNIITGINTGLAVYGATQQGAGGGGGAGACRAPSGCFQCTMTGQGDIAGCIDLLIAEFHRVEAQGNLQATLQAATSGLAALNNPSYFTQGNDAYLAQAKQVLTHTIEVIRGQITAAGGNPNATTGVGGTVSVLNANGQVVQVPAQAQTVVSGIPNSYLIGGGVAILALVYFLKK